MSRRVRDRSGEKTREILGDRSKLSVLVVLIVRVIFVRNFPFARDDIERMITRCRARVIMQTIVRKWIISFSMARA